MMNGRLHFKKFFISLTLFTIVFVSACSASNNNDSIHIGEGDNWQVTYPRGGPIVTKYIGDGDAPDTLDYFAFDLGSKHVDGNHTPLTDGEFREDTEIDEQQKDLKVTFKWGNESETFELVKQ